MLDIKKKYRTKSGKKVELLKVGMKNPVYPTAGIIIDEEPETVHTWSEDGTFNVPAGYGDLDLVEVKPFDDLDIGDVCLVSANGAFTSSVSMYMGKGRFSTLTKPTLGYTWDNYTKLNVNIKDFTE